MWKNLLRKVAVTDDVWVETSPVIWQNRFYRLEFIRKNCPQSSMPGVNFAQIRDMEKNRIVTTCMEGFELHSAFVWKNHFYVFATDYLNIFMSRSFDLSWWSVPQMVLNNRSVHIQHQNNSVCWDGERFIMAVDLLGGPYNFTICFAESRDLQEFRYVPGAVYRNDMYTSCPNLYYSEGYFYLIHLRTTRDWWFETFLTRSKDLVHWQDAPHNPMLSPNPEQALHRLATAKGFECNASDLELIEIDGKTVGYFSGGGQKEGADGSHQIAEFDGPMSALFRHYYDCL